MVCLAPEIGLKLHASHLQNHPLKFQFSFQFRPKGKLLRTGAYRRRQSIYPYDKIPVHPKVPTIYAVDRHSSDVTITKHDHDFPKH